MRTAPMSTSTTRAISADTANLSDGGRSVCAVGTRRETVDALLEQLQPLDVRVHPMFGDYALYCDEKVVGFVCDNTLLMKITDVSDRYAAGLPLGRPYPRAKDYHAIPSKRLHEVDWLHGFVQATADVLPVPKPKKTRRKT
jgi:TfoX/Sxy family transcriptional regulator of competence genes